MNKLVTTLEAQHRALEQIVGEVNVSLQKRDGTAIAEHLAKLKTMIHAHLSLENAQFYPAFETEEARGAPSAGVARMFAQNMRLIADGLGAFFTRYATPPSDLSRFEREWSPMVEVLTHRIAAEEQTLHPMFQALGR